MAADTGGWIGYDQGDNLALGTHVHQYVPQGAPSPEGWMSYTGGVPGYSGTVWRLRGYLRDTPLTPGAQVEDAAFAVYTPDRSLQGHRVVILLSTPGSLEFPKPDKTDVLGNEGRFAYLGHGSHDGALGGAGWPETSGFVLKAELSGVLDPAVYWVVHCSIVPRVATRPLLLQTQRNLQLVRAVQAMLQSQDPAWRPPPIGTALSGPAAVLVDGASFGGYVAVWSILLYPEFFHGGHSRVAPLSIRRYAGEQENWMYLSGLSGFGTSGQGVPRASGTSGKDFSLLDALSYSALLWQYKNARHPTNSYFSPFFHTSFIHQFNAGTVHRPMRFLLHDEDVTGSGTSSLPLLDGVRAYHRAGAAPHPTTGAEVSWIVVDRKCHQEVGSYTSPSGMQSADQDLSVLEMVPKAWQSFNANPNATFVPPGQPADGSEDPYDHVQNRGPYSPSTSGQGLALDPAFEPAVLPSAARRPGKSFGSGTWLGMRESLKTYNRAIYAGSAGGVVTRLLVNQATLEIEPTHMSPSLGYGAWGLAIGELDAGHSGEEVVVATRRGIHVLDSGNLSVIRSRTNLDWEWSAPQRLQVADLFADAGNEVLFVTELAEVVVLDSQLGTITNYGEGGVQDIVAHPSLARYEGSGASGVPITVLSDRGHVASVTLDRNGGTTGALLQASSDPINGFGIDLEPIQLASGSRIAALFRATNPVTGAIRVLDPLTMALDAQQPAADPADTSTVFFLGLGAFGRAMDLAILHDTGGTPYYVVLNAGTLKIFDTQGNLLGEKHLHTFAPAVGALALTVGDVGDWPDPTFAEDIVLSTEAGYVVWMPVQCVTEPGTGLPQGFTRTASNPGQFCNLTLAATWGMTAHEGNLEVVDQSGSRWRVAPDGTVTFLYELRNHFPNAPPSTTVPFLQYGPIRDLAWLGIPTSNQACTAVLETISPSPISNATVQRVLTKPPVPERPFSGLEYSPTWRNDWEHGLFLYDGFAVLPMGGDVIETGDPEVTGSDRQIHWWGAHEHDEIVYNNLLQGLYGNETTILSEWASTVTSAPPGSTSIPDSQVTDLDFRNTANGFAGEDMQSLRAFQDPGTGNLLLALATPGGSLIVVQPSDCAVEEAQILAESADHGYGAMALAVRPRQGAVDLYLGTTMHHTAPAGPPGDRMAGSIKVMTWTGGSLDESGTLHVLDAAGGQRAGFAMAGLAVGDALDSDPGDELVATTMNGDLYVFALDPGNTFNTTPRFRTELEGSLGAFNSIVIEDLDGDGKSEVYVAGSLGIRKLIQP